MQTLLLVFLIALSVNISRADDCKMGSESINLNNGNSTAGKTGTVQCKNSDGKVMRELEYKNGKHIGREMTVAFNGEKRERTVNEKGNTDGVEKVYNSKGTLIEEGHYINGSAQGKRTTYTPSGKLKHISWSEKNSVKFEVSYDENGGVENFKCGDKSYTEEDQALCGFNGKTAKTQLHGYKEKTVVYKDGKQQEVSTFDEKGKLEKHEEISGDSKKLTELFPDGKLKIEAQYVGHQLNGEEKEFHSSGKLIRKTNWDHGHMQSEEQYFLNGQMKERSSRKQKGTSWFIARELFWDNGKSQDVGVFAEKTQMIRWRDLDVDRWAYEAAIGEHRHFYENGQLAVIENYDDQGELSGDRKTFYPSGKRDLEEQYNKGLVHSRKEWSEAGVLTADDEYFEDGSKVSHLEKKKPGI